MISRLCCRRYNALRRDARKQSQLPRNGSRDDGGDDNYYTWIAEYSRKLCEEGGDACDGDGGGGDDGR